ncbi:BlaI/MecI/CopY family transcriptional regulator [soil metagenome]
MEVIFTDRELDLMGVLWEKGPCTVAQVREALTDELAYTTVLTVLRVLEQKGYVGHTEERRAHRYHSLVERSAAGESALSRLTRKLFRGSPEMLLTHLVADRAMSSEKLQSLRDILDQRLREEEE